MPRRSNPFRDRDWLYTLNDHPRAKYREYTLEELQRRYPSVSRELQELADRGQPINPITTDRFRERRWQYYLNLARIALAVSAVLTSALWAVFN